MEIVRLYEPASTDGYTHSGDGVYYLDESVARSVGKNRHGNYSVDPLLHLAIEIIKGDYLRLVSSHPVHLADSEKAKDEIREKALSKLSDEEKELLGL